ncbi:MAG: response regulator [Synechococcus sp.]|nr:response regulator [Synechococcus sp.]
MGMFFLLVQAVPQDNAQNSGDDHHACLQFTVLDTGIGIPRHQMSRLFQPFSQGDASTSRRYGGTGLGLVICKRLVQLMGGYIWVESGGIVAGQLPPAAPLALPELCQGAPRQTIFYAQIPFGIATPSPEAIAPSSAPPNLKERKLLILHPSILFAQSIQALLADTGITFFHAMTPPHVLDILRQRTIDILMLEASAGYIPKDFLRQLQQASQNSDLVIMPLVPPHQEIASDLVSPHPTQLRQPIKQDALYQSLALAINEPTPMATMGSPTLFDSTFGQTYPLRILMAEDNLMNQKVALNVLSRLGYQVDVVNNGLEVLNALQNQSYDVILMDIQMPSMDGLEATRQIRKGSASPSFSSPWIIAMTANAMQGDRQICLDAGMDDYLSKPIQIKKLLRALKVAYYYRQSNTVTDSPSL